MSSKAWFGSPLDCVIDHPGNTNGFARRVRRMEGVQVVCCLYKPRWHGFARYEVERRIGTDNLRVIETVESGWIWRGRDAPFYDFGPTQTELHGDVWVDNASSA
jgi:hypothetical protein